MKDVLQVEGRKKAVLFLVVAALLWSTGGMFIKYIQWPAMAIVGARSLLAAATVAVLAPQSRRFDGGLLVWLGGLFYAGMVMTLVIATKLTTSANAIFLQYTAPIYVALLSAWLLKEPVKKKDWLVIMFTAFGMALFFLGNFSFDSMLGNASGIASGVCFALFVISLRYIKTAEPNTIALIGNLLAFLFSLPFWEAPWPGVYGWLALCYLGIFQLGLSYVLYSRAVAHVSALEGVIIPVLEPILNPVWVFFFIGEQPSRWAMCGALIVVSVVTVYCWQKAGEKQDAAC